MLFLSLVFLQIVIFAILLLILRVYLSRSVTSATAHLNELAEDYTQKLEDSKKRLQEADRYYDQTILKAKVDAEKTKVQILKEAHTNQEVLLAQARKQSDELVEQANQTKEAILKELDRKVEERSIDKACELLQEILPQEVSKDMHGRWLEDLSKQGLEELARLNLSDDVHEARVVSAYALNQDQKTILHKKMKEKLHREIRLNEEVDPRLIAGFKITLGSVIIDGSLKFKIKAIAKHAKRSNQT